jgi:hypothetical protein
MVPLTKYILVYSQSTAVSVPSSELGLPLSRKRVRPPPPRNQRGWAHLFSGEVMGRGSQFGRLEKKLSTLSTLYYDSILNSTRSLAKETLFCQKKEIFSIFCPFEKLKAIYIHKYDFGVDRIVTWLCSTNEIEQDLV